MKNRYYYDFPGFLAIEYYVGELSYHRFSHIAVDHRMKLGVGGDPIEDFTDAGDEIDTQSDPLLLVPVRRGVELIFRLREKPDGETHRRSRASASASTCSHGMAACGFAR